MICGRFRDCAVGTWVVVVTDTDDDNQRHRFVVRVQRIRLIVVFEESMVNYV